MDVLCMFTGMHCGMYVRAPVVVVVQRRRHGRGSSAPEDTHVRMHVPHGPLLPSNAVKSASFMTPINSVIVHTPVDMRGAASPSHNAEGKCSIDAVGRPNVSIPITIGIRGRWKR
jgi:hypothetical protein